jgi:UDPglucose 6-dehydrogenase
MKVTVIGAGYVGLVTAAGLADMGNVVTCVESDAAKCDQLQSGSAHIHEPGLEPLLQANMRAGRLSFARSISDSAAQSDVFLIAVGTPPRQDGSPDMSYVHRAAAEVADCISKYCIIATKSTVPVGTADAVNRIVKEGAQKRGANIEWDVASNPEFLKEGAAVKDFMRPERIIIGCDSERAAVVLRRLYAPFVRSRERILTMRPREAEMTKYASNALLATKISFMNEMAELCEELDVDIEKVRAGVGADSRIGHAFLYAGCGYGGSCFPKDVKALIHTAGELNISTGILDAVEKRNTRQKRRLFDKVVGYFGRDLRGRIFAVWGLSFKPDTDDVRDAPALTIIELLLAAGANIRAYDPIAVENFRRCVPGLAVKSERLEFCAGAYEALQGADGVLLVTEWKEFRTPDFEIMKHKLRTPVIFDGRNQYDPQEVANHGLEYIAIGRGSTSKKASSAL